MQIIHIKRIIGLVALALALVSAGFADELDTPVLPVGCGALQVPAGNELMFRAYATGVQIYRWNGASWDFVAPSADLFASPDYRGKIGTHYVGPTWESNSGSKVVAARLQGYTPDASAIPWILLQTVSTSGRGAFRKVSFIQRLNTAGGLKPSLPGSMVGEEMRVPYTAENYFYRADDED